MGKTMSNTKKEKQATFKISTYQFDQMKQCCDMMGVSQSDFLRQAVSNQIMITYTQGMLSNMYLAVKKLADEVESKGLSGEYEEVLKDVDKYMMMYQTFLEEKNNE